MLPELHKVRGIHPGAILKRELKKLNIKAVQLAREIDEHPQTISAITKERRGINPGLSIKLGDFFGCRNDYFMLLQASFEVENVAMKGTRSGPTLVGKIRKSIFWDTQIETIDWEKHKRSVIQRLLERGNGAEIKELIRFYGLKTIKEEITSITNTFSPEYEGNVKEYILMNSDS